MLWPSCRASCSNTMRGMMSVVLPAPTGTMARSGFVGQVSPVASIVTNGLLPDVGRACARSVSDHAADRTIEWCHAEAGQAPTRAPRLTAHLTAAAVGQGLPSVPFNLSCLVGSMRDFWTRPPRQRPTVGLCHEPTRLWQYRARLPTDQISMPNRAFLTRVFGISSLNNHTATQRSCQRSRVKSCSRGQRMNS